MGYDLKIGLRGDPETPVLAGEIQVGGGDGARSLFLPMSSALALRILADLIGNASPYRLCVIA